MSAKRLLFVTAMLLIPSAVPRMASSGGERWFVISVPGPERFRLDEHNSHAPAANRAFGYPFTLFSQVGREFRTKEGILLFWPSTYHQPALRHRVSFASLFGDIALSLCASAALLFAVERYFLKVRPGRSEGSDPPADSADNPYRAPVSDGA